MTTITIESEHGLSRIQIADNPFAVRFTAKFKEILKDYPVKCWMVMFGWVQFTTDQFITEQSDKLQKVIDELNAMGVNFPLTVNKEILQLKNTQSQQVMNQLHRAFTTAHRSYFEKTFLWDDRTGAGYTIPPGQDQQFLYLIDQINHLVHKTEHYFKTERKNFNATDLVKQLEIRTDTYTNNNTRLLEDYYFTIDPADYQYASDSNEYDVWVGKDILGKDYLVAYYEHDDAGQWDITHVLGYSGKISIDITDKTRADVMQTADFRSWLAKGGVEYSPIICGMPIGTVIEGKQHLRQFAAKDAHLKNMQVRVDD
jgi:hypothetical protein